MDTKRKQMKPMLLAALVTIAAGCASGGSNDYARSEARVVQTVAYGTVESVRPVRLTEDKPIVGTLAGAALGGLLGNSIGHGGGRAAATVIGAVGGGIAGNAIERSVTAQDGQEIVVRLEDQTTIAVVQGGTQDFEAGQRVRVLTGPKGSRVETASHGG
jgi:outer membrane lipoprotein SlyB